MSNAVKVPQDVLDGLEAVRQSGLTNMLDRTRVQQIANEMGYSATVLWIQEEPKKTYAQGIFNGFEAEEE